MRRTFFGVAAGLLWINAALAQGGIAPGPGTVHSIPATYTGPGDIVGSATAWWGLRGYNGAVAATGTQKAANIIRASDSHTCDVLIATSGDLGNTANCSTGGDNGQSASAFCNSTTCKIITLFDQASGTYDVTQATSANRPTLSITGQNGHPTILWSSASATVLSSAVDIAINAQPFTESVVAAFNTNAAAQTPLAMGHAAVCIYRNTTSTIQLYAGSTGGAVVVVDGTWNALQGVFNGASSFLYVNGSSNSQNPGTGAWGSVDDVPHLGGTVDCGNVMDGEMGEGGLWPVGFTPTEAGNVRSNQSTYWGTP